MPSASKPNTTEAPPGQVEALPSRRVVRVFWSLAAINLFVGGMVGLERTVVPLLGEQVFGLGAGVAVAAFIISFSLSKAVMNLLAGFAGLCPICSVNSEAT